VAIAGRHGWNTVLAKSLDPENDLSLLNKREVIIRVALVSDEVLSELGDGRTRYSTVDTIIEDIEFAKKKLAREGYRISKLKSTVTIICRISSVFLLMVITCLLP